MVGIDAITSRHTAFSTCSAGISTDSNSTAEKKSIGAVGLSLLSVKDMCKPQMDFCFHFITDKISRITVDVVEGREYKKCTN
jgi:hypothetical protein